MKKLWESPVRVIDKEEPFYKGVQMEYGEKTVICEVVKCGYVCEKCGNVAEDSEMDCMNITDDITSMVCKKCGNDHTAFGYS